MTLDYLEPSKILQMYERFEPYHYFQNYILGAKSYFGEKKIVDLEERDKVLARFVEIGSKALKRDGFRVINIEKEILPLLIDTKPNFTEERRLPFNDMFFNQKIETESMIINGILLSWIDCPREGGYTISMSATIFDKKSEWEVYAVHNFHDDEKESYCEPVIEEDLTKSEIKRNLTLIKTITCNLLDLINNQEKEIEIFNQCADKEINKKRIKRNQQPHRDKLIIRLKGFTKSYAQYYYLHRAEMKMRFLVRGHWRTFSSDKYSEKLRGTKRWIYPYYKGNDLPEENKKFVEIISRM